MHEARSQPAPPIRDRLLPFGHFQGIGAFLFHLRRTQTAENNRREYMEGTL